MGEFAPNLHKVSHTVPATNFNKLIATYLSPQLHLSPSPEATDGQSYGRYRISFMSSHLIRIRQSATYFNLIFDMCSLTFLVLPASFAVTTCVGLLPFINIVLQYRLSSPVPFTYIAVFKLLTFDLVVSESSGLDILYFVLLKPFGFAESIRRGVRPLRGGGWNSI